MAEQRIQKTLEIRAEYSQALEGIAKYRTELDRAKAEAKLMTEELKNHAKQLKEGTISEEEHAKAVMETQKQLAANKQEQQQYSDAIRTTERVIKNQITQQNEAQDSLKAMRAQLSNLTKEYDEMGRAAREGAEGIEKLDAINDLTDKIKEAEEATQRYQRNVGNYTNSVEEAFRRMGMTGKMEMTQIISTGNSVVDSFINMATGAEGLKGALITAGNACKGLIKQFLALLATPVGVALAAIAAAYYAVSTAIEKDEQASNSWQKAIAPLRSAIQTWENAVVRLGNAIIQALTPIANIIAKVGAMGDALAKASGGFNIITGAAEAAWKVIESVAGAIDKGLSIGMKWAENLPKIGNAIKENNQRIADNTRVATENARIKEAMRVQMVEHSRIEKDVSELRAKAAQKDKYDATERKKYLEEAIALEKKMADDRVKMAQERFDNLKLEASLSSNAEEMNDALAEAEANVNRETTNYNNKLRELNAQLAEFTMQEQAAIQAENAAAEARRLAAKERADALKREKQEREDTLRTQKETEEGLWREWEDTLLALIKDGYEKQKLVITTQYQREIEALQKRLDKDKTLNKGAQEALRNLIISKRKQLNIEIKAIEKSERDEQIQKDADMLQRKAEVERMSMENRLASIQEGSLLFLELSRQQAEQEHALRQSEIDQELQLEKDRIANLVATEEEKNALLELAQQKHNQQSIANDQERAEKQKQIAKAEAQMKVDAYNSVKSGIDAMAQHSKAFAIMSKTIALAEIAINTGKAIAYGVTQAMKKGFPLALIDIALTLGTVLANMATAISTVKSAKFAKGGRVDTRQYATGGDVRGAGTGTSDSIHAMLSNGESVMTAAATSMYAPVLSAMNQSAGGNPITGGGSAQGEDMLARAVARGLMAMPNPVVSVEEINTTARRVQVLENLASV